jgi:hypothetical protein
MGGAARIHFIMADCTHIFLLKKLYLPDPQNQGQFSEAFMRSARSTF